VETKVQRIIVALITLTALGLAYASGALAADMSVPPPDFVQMGKGPPDFSQMGKAPPDFLQMGKAPPPIVTKGPMFTKAPRAVPTMDWTGFYIGADAGAAWADTLATWNPLPSPVAFGVLPISAHDRDAAFIGGGHAGYNYQFMPDWVGGVEADWTWTKANASFTQAWASDGAVVTPGSVTTMSTSLDWLASARGRVGYLVAQNIMAYATGGAAFARIDYGASDSNTTGYVTNAALSKTEVGYVVGGGVEWALNCNWLLRAEYLYYRFNDVPSVVATSAAAPGFPSGYSWGSTAVNVARAGVSYKF
jgi:outer membrane immunogenic protein